MEILFICKGNVARSQMASALFNKYSGRQTSSAGTNVFEKEGQKLKDIPLAEPVIRFMREEGLDVSENTRTQVTPEMVGKADTIRRAWMIKDTKGHSPRYDQR